MKKWKHSMYGLLKYSNMHRIGNPKRKDRENGTEAIYKKIMDKNIFWSEVKCINQHIKYVQEGYKQNFICTQQTKIILLLKYQRQEKIKNFESEKKEIFNGVTVKLMAEFSAEAIETNSRITRHFFWTEIFPRRLSVIKLKDF